MSKAKKHIARVRELGCVLCDHLNLGQTPAAIHHLFDPSQRSDFLIAPLCQPHHQGPNGFHGLGGEPGFRRRYNLGEVELLAMTLERLA